jgi:hypothetical protein
MNVAQESLGFRRTGFSPVLTLLMSAFALLIPPATLTDHLHRPTERSPTIQETEVRGQKSETSTRASREKLISNFYLNLAAFLLSLGTRRANAATLAHRYTLDQRHSAPTLASHRQSRH